MPLFKCTALFELFTDTPNIGANGPRVAGWSESLYLTSSAPDTALATFVKDGGACATRANLLPDSCRIAGERIQQVNPVGQSFPSPIQFVGASGLLTDIPQMAIMFYLFGKPAPYRHLTEIRGIPDARVQEGGFIWSADFKDAFNNWALALSDYTFPAQDVTVPKLKIAKIDPDGTVTLNVNNPYVPGDSVSVTRSLETVTKRQRGVKTSVLSTGPAVNQFKLAFWPWNASKGGSVQKVSIIQVAYDGISYTSPRAAVRKVGRPFALYRGKRPAMRI